MDPSLYTSSAQRLEIETGECVQSHFPFATQAKKEQGLLGRVQSTIPSDDSDNPALPSSPPILTSAALCLRSGDDQEAEEEEGAPTCRHHPPNDTYRHTRQSSGLGRSYCSRRGDVFENAAFTRPTTTLFFFVSKTAPSPRMKFAFTDERASTANNPSPSLSCRPFEGSPVLPEKRGTHGKCRLVFLAEPRSPVSDVSWGGRQPLSSLVRVNGVGPGHPPPPPECVPNTAGRHLVPGPRGGDSLHSGLLQAIARPPPTWGKQCSSPKTTTTTTTVIRHCFRYDIRNKVVERRRPRIPFNSPSPGACGASTQWRENGERGWTDRFLFDSTLAFFFSLFILPFSRPGGQTERIGISVTY